MTKISPIIDQDLPCSYADIFHAKNQSQFCIMTLIRHKTIHPDNSISIQTPYEAHSLKHIYFEENYQWIYFQIVPYECKKMYFNFPRTFLKVVLTTYKLTAEIHLVIDIKCYETYFGQNWQACLIR